ncbi:hypothetical protein MUK42_10702 [Musa troglodytarum]|uniref:DUF8204 domain-containing protein n=1 Tax=Musa troglodytarum TaxID=320322 RepID=A0A9E7KG27_9LILI|nr:hypothetical protein MUK42_10702 [Musa troglodytarum]
MEESSSGGGADRGGGDAGDSLRNASQGKSCKGCLYYSSLLRSDSRNPFCLGLTRPLKQVVPSSIVGESEMEADKEGRSLSDFRYVCVGYSVFLNNKENTTENQENQAKLPFCVGLELLVDRKTSAAEHVPTHVHNKEVAFAILQFLFIRIGKKLKWYIRPRITSLASFPGVRGLWPQV